MMIFLSMTVTYVDASRYYRDVVFVDAEPVDAEPVDAEPVFVPQPWKATGPSKNITPAPVKSMKSNVMHLDADAVQMTQFGRTRRRLVGSKANPTGFGHWSAKGSRGWLKLLQQWDSLDVDEFVAKEGSDFHKELTHDDQDSEVRGRALRKLSNMVVDHCQKSLAKSFPVLSEAERAAELVQSGKRMERIRLAEDRADKLHAAQKDAERRMNEPGMVEMLESFKQSIEEHDDGAMRNDRSVKTLFDKTEDALVRFDAMRTIAKKIRLDAMRTIAQW